MTEWRKVKLGDISQSIQTGPFGSQLHQSDYSQTGIPVVMPKDIVNGKIDDISIARVEEQHIERLAKHKISENDIIYPRRGDVGKCAYVNNKQNGWLCGTGCLRVTIDKEKADSKFVFFQLQKRETIGWIENHAIGATMLNLNTSILSNVPITLPSLDVQRRIAEMLSRYDALIENYQRQIKLLEEAAQRLYKEWFVDLRFPGHQSTPIINNLPQSWQKKKLGEIARLKAGGDKPKVFSSEKTFELTIPVYSNGTINEGLYGYTNTAEISVPCVTISARGSVGYTVLRRTPFVPIVRLISVIPDDIYVGYLFFYIKDMPLDSNGAAQQQITVPMIKDKEIIIPENGVLNGFRSQVEPFFITVDCLKRSIRNLSEARDRLLPKLMSGEITNNVI